MKTNIFSIQWNEESMLPHFLKHYDKYADRIFIIDDHSDDKTRLIAMKHPKVILITYKYNGLNEDEFNETFESLSKQYPSDWAVCVDADEFIQGLETLKDELPGVLKTKGYAMLGKTGKLKDCKPVREARYDKPVVFDPSLDIKFGHGRHTANIPARDSYLELWHYKYLSKEHYLYRALESYPRIMDAEQMDYRIKRGLEYYERHIT
jgi:glycosyltransferase involved in cell wall biosynthesis